jgi:hypothetical protein
MGWLSSELSLRFISDIALNTLQYPWTSTHVLGTLIPGAILIVIFCVWENSSRNKFPMFPERLRESKASPSTQSQSHRSQTIDPRILGLTLVITAVSGANFFSVLMFWPTQAFNTYDQDPVGVGLRGLPIGIAIMVGCCVVLVALTVLRGHIRLLMVLSNVIMTIGVALISLSTPTNMNSKWIRSSQVLNR